ncbi:MAG: tetratricopeptide repeat protein [Cyclobacteriaceae bacterium]
MRYIYFILLIKLVLPTTAQNSTGINPDSQSRVIELFQSEKYEAALLLLESKGSRSISEEFMIEISRLKLGGQDQTKLEKLVAEHSKSPGSSLAGFTLGKFYFHKGSIDDAGKYLRAVDTSDLPAKDRKDHYFMRGYVSLTSNEYSAASGYFDRAFQLDTEDRKVIYYQGFTSYHLNQKEKAFERFTKVQEDDEYSTSANYFLAKIRLENGKYDEVIEMAQSQLTDETSETNSAFYQLIGEAWALKNQADKASNFFGRAIELHPGKPSAALYYQAGVANFKLGLKNKAIKYFIESGIRSGDYAQLSAFQLGRLYVSSNEPEKASNAYIEASASSDPKIKEESVFMAGKLLIDQKNYSEGIKYLQDYLRTFKSGEWVSEAQQVVAEAYLRTSNYDQAIAHLKEIGITTESRKSVYQKVTYQKGQLLFNDVRFKEAIQWMKESVNYSVDLKLENDALFILAESFFNLSNYKEAVSYYMKQRQPDSRTWYGLGYAHYNLQQYSQAVGFFEKFLAMSPERELKLDAQIRLSDAYYATKAYQKALGMYERANQQSKSDYLFYQIGLVKKNLGDGSGAVNSFNQVINFNSTLSDAATFQIAQLNFEKAEFERAAFHFSELISKYPKSIYLPEAYLNRAVSYTNLERLNEAGNDYEYILKNHIQSKIAFNAILGLQELESKGVKIKDIEGSIEKYKQANPNDKSLEVVEFEFAKSQYFNQDYTAAATAFRKFISGYPNSSHLIQARYYLADAYFRQGDLQEANVQFSTISGVRNELTGRVLSRLGDINYSLGNYAAALNRYGELTSLNLSSKDTYNGRLGQMNTFYKKADYEGAIRLADEIVADDWKPLNGERNAVLIRAKSYMALGNTELSIENFKKITDNPDVIGAEAMYNLALIAFNKGNHQESIDLLFDFNSRFGSYTAWIDKSYLLIADNYVQKQELFQAKATLRSIIQHSTDEEARLTAEQRLKAIESLVTEDTISKKDNK